jgi:mRNA interferase MazF
MVTKSLERGDIVWVDFSPTMGREQSGLRPAVVVSGSKYNNISGLILAVPMTSKRKGYLFEVPIQGPKGKSYILSDQIRSFDIAKRVAKKSGKVSDSEINEILARAAVLFQ